MTYMTGVVGEEIWCKTMSWQNEEKENGKMEKKKTNTCKEW